MLMLVSWIANTSFRYLDEFEQNLALLNDNYPDLIQEEINIQQIDPNLELQS